MNKSLFFVIVILFSILSTSISSQSQSVKRTSNNVIVQADSSKIAPKVESKVDKLRKIVSIHFGVILPTWGSGDMGTCAGAPRILTYSQYKAEYGKVSSFGYGIGADIKLGDKGLFLTFDSENISYSQEVYELGHSAFSYTDPSDGMRYDVTLPLGLKYTTSTVGLRPGIKYAYTKYEKFHPWLAINYGLYLWNVKYISMEKNHIYGQDNGTSTRLSWGLGVDFLFGGYTLTPYIDANAPIANYSMEALFGYGDYNRFDGHLYPGLRIGLRVGGF
jgi:hypothetical protein